jgi:nitrite reductase (NADH) small subunit
METINPIGLRVGSPVAVCPSARLTVNRGVAALIAGRAVALFALPDGTVAAIDNLDPCSGASVLSRGIVGEVDGAFTVASPLYKQRFDLRTGCCLDAEGVGVAVHRATVVDGMLLVEVEPIVAGQSR